jgi:hypothetical protein
MRIGSITLPQSLLNIGSYCCERLNPLYQKISSPILNHPYAKSIVGRVVLCSAAETVGGLVGGLVGGACLGAIGTPVGIILGGYAGLKATNANVPFWDATIQCDGYAVGMTKFLFVGEVLEATLNHCPIPYVGVPINVARKCAILAAKSIAYNSSTVISTLKAAVRERSISHEVLVPLLVKIGLNRYCEANAVPITSKLINVINVIPRTSALFSGLFSNMLAEKIQSLSNRSDLLANALMRSFHEYVTLITTSQRIQQASTTQALKDALKQEIIGAKTVSPLFDKVAKESIKDLSTSLLETIQQSEQDLTGYCYTAMTIQQKEILSIHMKYFFIFALLKYDTKAISSDEERAFFIDVNRTLFSLYKPLSLPGLIGKVTHTTLQTFFGFRKWIYPFIEQREESARLYTEVQRNEDYVPVPTGGRAKELRWETVGKT